MLCISYRSSDLKAQIGWDASDEQSSWLDVVRRLLLDQSEGAAQEDAFRIALPWWSFVALRPQLFEIFKGYNLAMGEAIQIDSGAIDHLRHSKRNADVYHDAIDAPPIAKDVLISQLISVGFTRELSKEQYRNVGRMASFPAAATFSVPGAGKTTEALAVFFYRAEPSERLLVVAPKNAFAAWDEQITDCVPLVGAQFSRLRGGKDNIAKQLSADPRFMIISYQQLARVPELIAAHCARYKTHVFLDESHRIKSGTGKQTARAALTLAHLPVGKLIMSGTPMPQSTEDLIPQLAFLYPEVIADETNVVELIKPIYVRTNKQELGLPQVTRHLVQLTMAPMQKELYRLMKFEVSREAASALNIRSRQAFRSLGRSVARLLQFTSNPALLSSQISFAHPDLLTAVLSEGEGPKLKYVFDRVRTLANEGHKVLVWSSFVQNVEYLASRFSDLGAVFIHGGVDAGDESDDDTREGKIRAFHDDPAVQVLVANPAAASEGISLHRICHHALYLDRTFNAAHYLQSEDRIHRFGLKPSETTTIEIVECRETVDETVRSRLNFKIGRMAAVLEDSALRPDAIPLDPNQIDDMEEYSTGLAPEDIDALLRHLGET